MIELKELRIVCDLKNGFAFKSEDYVEYSKTVSLRMSNIRPGGSFDSEYNQRFLPDNFKEKYSQYLLSDGDLVIAMTDLATDPKILGVPTIVETNGKNWLLNQRVGKLVIRDNLKADKTYLRYILNHPIHKNYYRMFAGGGLQINIGKNEILSLKIPLPPIEIQKKIANILDNAASLRNKTEQLIKEYDLLEQSIFLTMFGDPVRNEKGWNTEIGENLCKKISVGIVIKPASYYVDNGILALRSLNIKKNHIDLTNIVQLSKEAHLSVLKKSILKTGDIVVVRTGNTGTAAIIPESLNGVNCIDLIIIRPDINIMNSKFFIYFLNSERGKLLILGKSVGGIQKHFNVGSMKKLVLPVPPLTLQNEFAEKITLIEKQKVLAKKELKESEDLLNCLLQKAFRGELV
ncbi:restriction endonuclease subunit S [Flavobacterium sp. SLB02]|uniref:restriction endonuclease subunit S n=1 Tax=Flavobacterium sp. SLB02 TaxID=2665645 RepID=UPI0012A80C19|nr:restriction endonuclease subunit S [Flavobacterium sp. SLB02]QGK73212.1 hypothetical protein GIY83_03775 [Flavobacterium sp. SLB02]